MFGVRRHRMVLTEGGGGSCVRCARRQATESMRVQVSVMVLTVTMRATVVVVLTAVVVVVVVVLGDGLRRSTRQRNVGGHGVAGAEGNNTHRHLERPTKDLESGVGRARGSEVGVQLPLGESDVNRLRRVTSRAVSGAEATGSLAVRPRPCHLPIQQACRLR